jgi:DNA-binding FadR family transcriptional regulator
MLYILFATSNCYDPVMPDTITQGTVSERVRPDTQALIQQILDLFASGEIGSSGRLPAERRLAERFGVGRSVIREALAALETLGVVDTRIGAGTYFRQSASELLPQTIEWGLLLGRPQTSDLVEARAIIEVASAGLAAERASQSDLDRLASAMEDMELAVGSPNDFINADVQFHLEVARIARNTVLAGILASIRSLLEVWIRRASGGREEVADTLTEHRRVADAIRSRDSNFARSAMKLHMDCASRRLHATLDLSHNDLGAKHP